MVCDKLHIICGNCGHDSANNNFKFEYIKETEDNYPDVEIFCENCGTIHTLSKYMDELKEVI